MYIHVDVSAFRRSLEQPPLIRVRLDTGATLGDLLALLTTDLPAETEGLMLDAQRRSAAYFVVNGTVVTDLSSRLSPEDRVAVLPVIGGG